MATGTGRLQVFKGNTNPGNMIDTFQVPSAGIRRIIEFDVYDTETVYYIVTQQHPKATTIALWGDEVVSDNR